MTRRRFLHYAPMFILRLILLAYMVQSGRWLSLWPVFAVESASLVLGTWNAWAARSVADWSAGLATNLAYVAGVFILPMPGHAVPASTVAGVFWLSFMLSAWALWHLRECFTYGSPTFVRQVCTGPYAYFPHPQAFARGMLEVVLLASCWGDWRNVSRACAGLVLTLIVVAVEVRFRSWYIRLGGCGDSVE